MPANRISFKNTVRTKSRSRRCHRVMVPLVTFGAYARAKVARFHCPKGGLCRAALLMPPGHGAVGYLWGVRPCKGCPVPLPLWGTEITSALNQGTSPVGVCVQGRRPPAKAGYIGGHALLNTPMCLSTLFGSSPRCWPVPVRMKPFLFTKT